MINPKPDFWLFPTDWSDGEHIHYFFVTFGSDKYTYGEVTVQATELWQPLTNSICKYKAAFCENKRAWSQDLEKSTKRPRGTIKNQLYYL